MDWCHRGPADDPMTVHPLGDRTTGQRLAAPSALTDCMRRTLNARLGRYPDTTHFCLPSGRRHCRQPAPSRQTGFPPHSQASVPELTAAFSLWYRIGHRGRIHAGKRPQSAPAAKREGRIEAVCQRHGRRRARPKGFAQGASGLRCLASRPARPCTAYPRLVSLPAPDERHLMPV